MTDERSIHVDAAETDSPRDGQLAKIDDRPPVMIGEESAQAVIGECDLFEGDQSIEGGDRPFVEPTAVGVHPIAEVCAVDDLFEDQATRLLDESRRGEPRGPSHCDYDPHDVQASEDLVWWEKVGLREDPIKPLEKMMPKGFSEEVGAVSPVRMAKILVCRQLVVRIFPLLSPKLLFFALFHVCVYMYLYVGHHEGNVTPLEFFQIL